MLKKFLLLPLIGALAVMLAPPAPTFAEHLDEDVDLKHEVVPFIVKMNFGDPDHTIAMIGDLEVFVRCTKDFITDSIMVLTLGTSSAEFAGGRDILDELFEGGDEVLLSFAEDQGLRDLVFGHDIGQGSFVQDGSHYIAIDGETQSQGVNIFGFDCFTAGEAVLISEEDGNDD